MDCKCNLKVLSVSGFFIPHRPLVGKPGDMVMSSSIHTTYVGVCNNFAEVLQQGPVLFEHSCLISALHYILKMHYSSSRGSVVNIMDCRPVNPGFLYAVTCKSLLVMFGTGKDIWPKLLPHLRPEI